MASTAFPGSPGSEDDTPAIGVDTIFVVCPGVVWSYQGDEAHPFYSMTCGTCQRLPNGNTLITESDSGRAFEVTRDKEIVWEYVSPYRSGANGELIATLFHVTRVKPDQLRWLGR
ncbi:MAG: arylsulfotransferase family protein [Planctomycetota bacterium]